MKLHSLSITAFGPFAKTEKINFDQLGHNPLFLIDGPTGAGKSSILHAISYALFGETTDADRKDEGLRSDHADQDLLTELSLEFSIRTDRYRISRIPPQKRPTLRGAGETDQSAVAELVRIEVNGSTTTLVAKKKTEADNAIRGILGLTSDQFRQVMVLPQGKFRELLLAKSSDRQGILSTLFQTQVYKAIEQILNEQANAIERENTRFEQRIKDELDAVDVKNREELRTSVGAASLELELCRRDKTAAGHRKVRIERRVQLARQQQMQFRDLQTKRNELRDHEAVVTETIEREKQLHKAEIAGQIKPIYTALQIQNRTLAEASVRRDAQIQKLQQTGDELKVGETRLKQVAAEYPVIEPLKVEKAALDTLTSRLPKYKEQVEQVQQATESAKAAAATQYSATTAISATEADLKQIEEGLKALDLKRGSATQTADQLNAAKNLLKTAESRASRSSDLQLLEHKLVSLSQDYQTARSNETAANREADLAELKWHQGQAQRLAQQLETGSPCPVCGSLDHPSPASTADIEVVEHAQVKTLREVTAAKSKTVSDYFSQLEIVRGNVASVRQALAELDTELAEQATCELSEFQDCVNQLTAAKARIEQEELDRVELSGRKEHLTQQRTRLIGEREVAQANVNKQATELATAEESLRNLAEQVPEIYRQPGALESRITRVAKQITDLENRREEAITTVNALEKSVASEASSLNQINAQLKRETDDQLSAQTDWDTALSASEFNDLESYQIASLDPAAQQQLKQDIASYHNKTTELKAVISTLETQLIGLALPDIRQLEVQKNLRLEAYTSADTRWSDASTHLALLNRVVEQLASIDQEQLQIREQYEVIGKLAKAASGRGEVRVSLERYVLGNLLDRVLTVASYRLQVMSKGKYRLVRQDETGQKRNVTAGLDLAVDDAHSGKTRSVSTLSGGESFIASLSLALALSDVVQQRSGGIQLDTLFVDEGFGSLDQESLQLAIDSLIELQSTGRTIGIISHVSELKEQFPLRIDVESGLQGSTIRMTSVI